MVTLIDNFRLFDLLDILIVAFILYRIILLIKNTMAIRVVTGLVVVFLFYVTSQFLELPTLNWILSNFLGSIILVMVVIFQTDIRRTLLTFGINLARDQHVDELAEVIHELANAVEILASKQVGALIVVERSMELGNFIEVGTEVDAKVTSEILTSIFLPYSPIHDGAVIIQRGKLTMAGCFLPLTRNPGVDKTLGTRHRAALGLSELVDAVVVVVSEETGTISVVSGGKITRDLDSAMLRKVLMRLLEPARDQWRQP